ncbi:hypothetical protein GCM10028825_35230 [Spirosoma agri]
MTVTLVIHPVSFSKSKAIMINNTTPQLEVLTIVELEERFETTVAALDSARCSDNKADVSLQ